MAKYSTDTDAETDSSFLFLPDASQGLSSLESTAFCLCVATVYVFSLYLIPASVRRLSRNHATHVSTLC